jgi:hypothetical protein
LGKCAIAPKRLSVEDEDKPRRLGDTEMIMNIEFWFFSKRVGKENYL